MIPRKTANRFDWQPFRGAAVDFNKWTEWRPSSPVITQQESGDRILIRNELGDWLSCRIEYVARAEPKLGKKRA